ncbi:putative Translin-1 [Rhizodiscina lignyota]|uniref:Translin-1 n=1 Tax=Rhizodiscina lignyota TaxID=1504668 RepID=A0A9P4IRD4_9PEZI|nr:putative Translin-1 [Rhizodiscina lignyota]
MASQQGMVDAAIFEDLQARVDQDATFRDEIKEIVQVLEKQTRTAQSILSKAHSTPTSQINDVITAGNAAIQAEADTVAKLSTTASQQPYYKWNNMWSRQMQDVIFSILLCGWLGANPTEPSGQLLTIERVASILNIPVNLKDRDAFHITIEEYLQALISLLDELARLARNSVTLGDYRRPLQISQFVKDVHAGFQILNLKNDSLRRRSDGIKYRVKEVEDVVYDLSLRNLIPKE